MGAHRRAGTLLLGFLLAVALVACSSDGDDSSSDEGGGGVTVAGDKGTPVAVEVGENPDGTYYMKVDRTSAPAGAVTFTMKNVGTKEHEMVVLKTDTAADKLTVSDHKVSEADSVGEISETEAGKTASKTLDLEAGSYVLVCNIAKHYEKDMFSAFTVT